VQHILIGVTSRFKACAVCCRSNTRTVGYRPSSCVGVYVLLFVWVALCRYMLCKKLILRLWRSTKFIIFAIWVSYSDVGQDEICRHVSLCQILYTFIIIIVIIIILLSWSWTNCRPVPVSRVQKSLQRSNTIPSARWGVVFHYPG
jgi:hypothetical protein